MNFVRGDRSSEPLQVEAPDRLGIDRLLDGCEDPRADEGLPGGRVCAEAGGEIGHRSERRVVVATLEADTADRRVPGLDPDPESQLRTTLAPDARQFLEPP